MAMNLLSAPIPSDYEELAAEERRTARTLYRQARSYATAAKRYAETAASATRHGNPELAATWQGMADANAGRVDKHREWARNANARARRYDAMAARLAARLEVA